jgi:hypothetical protein
VLCAVKGASAYSIIVAFVERPCPLIRSQSPLNNRAPSAGDSSSPAKPAGDTYVPPKSGIDARSGVPRVDGFSPINLLPATDITQRLVN